MDIIAELVEDMSDIQQLDDFLSVICSSLSCLSYIEYNTFGLRWDTVIHPNYRDEVLKESYFRGNLHSYNDKPAKIIYYHSDAHSCRKQWMKCGKLHRETKTTNGFLNPAYVVEGYRPIISWYVNEKDRDEYIEIDGQQVRLPDFVSSSFPCNNTDYRPLIAIKNHILKEFGHYITTCGSYNDHHSAEECFRLTFNSPSYYNNIKLPEISYQ